MVPLTYYLLLSGILFVCGVLGFLIKRNIITIFMSIELMLNGVNLSFVAFAAHWHALSGQIFVFFVMVVAAAEAAVGLAIIIAVYRTRETLNVDQEADASYHQQHYERELIEVESEISAEVSGADPVRDGEGIRRRCGREAGGDQQRRKERQAAKHQRDRRDSPLR